MAMYSIRYPVELKIQLHGSFLNWEVETNLIILSTRWQTQWTVVALVEQNLWKKMELERIVLFLKTLSHT